ncbi:MAG: exopolysaccharide Pel transporter PelG [Planctomycetes bacterium]|nr:exopolysaccharide Pel transporter PelG [Planctomycetota bacterium]
MAGIGFKIQKLLSEDTYWGVLKGYFYSAVISSGPWLISILCIGALGLFSRPLIGQEEHAIFRIWVMYCYAASLVVSGAVQMLITRYISDCIHGKRTEVLLASFITYSLPVFAIQLTSAYAYLLWSGFSSIIIYSGALLYAIITLIWIAMIYLSAAKDYLTIVFAYLIGAVASIAGASALAGDYGLPGVLGGYTAGQAILLAVLVSRIVVEFPSRQFVDPDCLRFLTRYPLLGLTGLFYNAAIWVDKLLFWIYEGREIHRGFYTCPFYETPTYLAFVTIVPALSIFLIRIETSFYTTYREYYLKVTGKYSLGEILASKRSMWRSLSLSFARLFIFQGSVTAVCFAYSHHILMFFKMDSYQLGVLRITILGAFFHSLLMVLFIMILYFDWRHLALRCSLVFLITNAVFTGISLNLDISWRGYGYFFASLLTLCYGTLSFLERFDDLEYITFSSQPLGGLTWSEKA